MCKTQTHTSGSHCTLQSTPGALWPPGTHAAARSVRSLPFQYTHTLINHVLSIAAKHTQTVSWLVIKGSDIGTVGLYVLNCIIPKNYT